MGGWVGGATDVCLQWATIEGGGLGWGGGLIEGSIRVPRPSCLPPPLLCCRYVLKNVARDWSAEGAAERAQSYGRILGELRRLFAGWVGGCWLLVAAGHGPL